MEKVLTLSNIVIIDIFLLEPIVKDFLLFLVNITSLCETTSEICHQDN